MKTALLLIFFLVGCANKYYDDNPRNMQNMTAEEIRKELNQPKPKE